ncbi:helix-turn-helix domain-containing protein [Desulfitobacterium sp.]|uniref:helix-turn-helix domain-containing protein n=1 Tax=Desulfitobacterium sp. TaxID=49981 RepID=UPI002BE6698A|nr:helix-turn-helix domain-containing protein [Desulfitobacterium sp.]HVJ47505.1 helix-turn-helix domain-containing protein [Desulfitobacterium sp.]
MDQRFKLLCQSQHISLSELARRSMITPGYLSKILNGKTPNVSLGILARISEQLALSLDELLRIIKDKDYLPEGYLLSSNPEHQPESFKEAVQMALDAIERNDHESFETLTERIRHLTSPLQVNYENWFEGIHLAYNNDYNAALDKFLQAQRFKAHSIIERRLKAKILFGIASMYLGKGDYKKALLNMRKSLITWDVGVHVGAIYLNMGTLNRRNRDYISAELCYRSALLISVDYIQLLAYAGLGQLYMDQKKSPEARAVLLQGYGIARKTPEDQGKGELFCNLGKYYNESGLPEKAIRVLKRGLVYTTTSSSKRTRLYLLIELLDAYNALGQSVGIAPILQKLQTESSNNGDILLISNSLLIQAKTHLREGHPPQALPLLNQCYRLLSPVSPTQELMTCCNLLSECYFQQKDPFQADFFIRESKRLRKVLKIN